MSAICQIKDHLPGAHRVMVNKRIELRIICIRIIFSCAKLLSESVKSLFCCLKFLRRVQDLFATLHKTPSLTRITNACLPVLPWDFQNAKRVNEFSILIHCKPIIQNQFLPRMRSQRIRCRKLRSKKPLCLFIFCGLSECRILISESTHWPPSRCREAV